MSQGNPQTRTNHLDPASMSETLKLSITRDYVPTAATAEALPLRDGSRFRLRQFHAQGGLGVVSVAEDLELQRSVAFKQIQPKHADNPDSRRRFLLEAEITGKLEHPGVVPVYGLVADERGQPAYAMRFIQGETLADAIYAFHHDAGHRVPLAPPVSAAEGTAALAKPVAHAFGSVKFRQLLARFVALCNTIAFAHSRGIIHRDIKPANLMLGGFGESLVLDWGLARPFDHRTGVDPQEFAAEDRLRPTLSDSGANETAIGTAVGTPAYMAPEQAEGRWDAVGPAADVYSLGATLYTLLTGARPCGGKDVHEVLQAVRQGQFRPPREVNPHIPKPLAAICLRAMALEPHGRYASALELAEDIEHYLADDPVTAYRESFSERARRWGRKHRALVTAAVASVVVGLFGLIIATVLLTAANTRERLARTEAEDQRERADGNLQRAKDAVEKYLTEVAADPQLKQEDFHELRKRLLQTAVPFYEEFSRQQEHEPARRADVGRAYGQLAFIQDEMSQREQAVANYEQARNVFAALAADFPAVPHYRWGLAVSDDNRARLLADLGRRSEAEAVYRRAIEIEEQLAAQFPTVAEYRQGLAISHIHLGELLNDVGKRVEAQEAYRRAMGIHEELAVEFPTVPKHRQGLAESHTTMGNLLKDLGEHSDAEKAYNRAVEILEQMAAQFPTVAEYRQGLAISHIHLGNLLQELGKRSAAEKAYRRAIKIQEQMAVQFASVPRHRQDLAVSYNNLGALLQARGDRLDGEKAYRRAIEICEQLAKQFPTVPEYRQNLADSHGNLGVLLWELGRRTEAEKAYGEALEIQEELAAQFPSLPQYQHKLASSHNNRGNLLQTLGKHSEAERAYRRAIEIREQLAKQFPTVLDYRVRLAGSYVNFGALLSNGERTVDALDWFGKAIKLLEPVVQADARLVEPRQYLRNGHATRALAFMELARYGEALSDWDRAFELDEGPSRSRTRMRRALCLARVDPPRAVAEAEELARGEKVEAGVLYDAACVCSLAAANVKDELSRARYADRAMDFLRQAVARAFKDAQHMKQDADLAALRERDDFRKLLAELEAAAAKKTAKE